MPFQPGWHPTHDVAAAGRKGKANSPWRKPMNPKTARLHNIRRAQERLLGLPVPPPKGNQDEHQHQQD